MKRTLAVVVTLSSFAASAHAIWLSPVPRDQTSYLSGPCGTAAPQANPTVYTPGQSVTVTWKELASHGGSFRIAYSPDGSAAAFDQPANLLASAIPNPAGTQTNFSQTITIPAAPCTGCILQLKLTDGANNYFSCADMRIQASTNVAPTVTTAASAPVGATTAQLSVRASDDSGEAGLTYTWSSTGPAPVVFSANGNNAAKNSVATFSKVGVYSLLVTIRDGGGLTVTSTVSATVNATVTAVGISPATASVLAGGTQQFAASATDQFVAPMAATFTWSATGGSVSSTGLFTAGAAGGAFQVTAMSAGKSASANVTVTVPNTAPVITTAASGTPAGALSVRATDDSGEAGLSYTWATTGSGVTFSVNGTNAAKDTVATFTRAGTYPFAVTVRDAAMLSVTSSVTVTVSQLLTTISVTPATVSVAPGATAQFSAALADQFGAAMSGAVGWSVSGGGTLSTSGLFTAGTTSGTYAVTATSGTKTGTASVTVTAAPNVAPTVTTAASGTPAGALSVRASDDSGEAGLVYTWATTGTGVTFSVNGSNAAKDTVATFTHAGTYAFTVTIRDGGGLTVTSSVSITVNQSLTTVTVTPATASVLVNATQQLTAAATDQFGASMTAAFTWTATSGSVSSAGLFTAGASAGTSIVTASSGGRSANATLTVTAAPNVAPVITTAASAVAASTTATLSVRASDDSGEPALIYTWAATGPAPVVFSANGTNAAKDAVATFSKAGAYTFMVTIRDAGNLSVTSAATLTVSQTVSAVQVSPASAAVVAGGMQQFTASAIDQFANAMTATYAWTSSGMISPAGLFTAGASAGPSTVTATAGGKQSTANVTVTAAANGAPVVTTAASAQPPVAGGTQVPLSVLANDDGSEALLTYTWATSGASPAPVSFSVNGTNAAKSTTATFTKAGVYAFVVTIIDAQSLQTTSTVTVRVDAQLTRVRVSPVSLSMKVGATQQFTASALDQFNEALLAPPATVWMLGGAGTLGMSGLFTAPGSAGGTSVITATVSAFSASAIVMVTAADAPEVVTVAQVLPSPVTGQSAQLSVLGMDDSGEAALTYSWAVKTGPGSVVFSANGSNAAKSTTVTFNKAGAYRLEVTLTDAARNLAFSDVDLEVTQTLTSLELTPPVGSVGAGGTLQFSALCRDQFGAALSTPPEIAWSVTGGGTISGSGLLTADRAAFGRYRVVATAGSVSKSALFSVEGSPLQVAITSPTADAHAKGSIELTAETSGGAGVTELTFELDGVMVATMSDAPWSASLDTGSLSDGDHWLVAIAKDEAGGVARSQAVPIHVENRHETTQGFGCSSAGGGLLAAAVLLLVRRRRR